MKRVLVTGGAGFIGSHTVDALIERGYVVRVLDILHPRVHPGGRPAYLHGEAEFVQGDVSDRQDLARALDGVHHVFHLAAYQDYLPDFSTFVHVNVESTALLFELITGGGYPVEKVVIASSQAVYGEGSYWCDVDGHVSPGLRDQSRLDRGEWEPACPRCGGRAFWRMTDERAASPQNPYALSKHSQEMIGLTLGRRYQIPTVALRYSIVQGPRQSCSNAYSGACRIFCLSVHVGRDPIVYEDGQQLRDFINIRDVVAANLLVLERSEADYQAFNVGGGTAYTVLDLANVVARVFGKSITPRISCAYRLGDARHSVSDISKLQALGWAPRHTPEESVRDYVAWLSEQDDLEDVLGVAEHRMRHLNVVRPVRV